MNMGFKRYSQKPYAQAVQGPNGIEFFLPLQFLKNIPGSNPYFLDKKSTMPSSVSINELFQNLSLGLWLKTSKNFISFVEKKGDTEQLVANKIKYSTSLRIFSNKINIKNISLNSLRIIPENNSADYKIKYQKDSWIIKINENNFEKALLQLKINNIVDNNSDPSYRLWPDKGNIVLNLNDHIDIFID
jgi:hypothetical protein